MAEVWQKPHHPPQVCISRVLVVRHVRGDGRTERCRVVVTYYLEGERGEWVPLVELDIDSADLQVSHG